MGRKRSTTQLGPEANGVQAPQATKPANKQDAVRLALEAGVTSPTAIAQYVQDKFGMEMTVAHVSTTKGILIRQGKARKKRKPGRKPGKKRAEQADGARARVAATTWEEGLTPQDLRLLSEMAQRAGGYAQLRQFIDVLGGGG
jgi:hypothetical protein